MRFYSLHRIKMDIDTKRHHTQAMLAQADLLFRVTACRAAPERPAG